MAASAWKRLLAGRPWFKGEGNFPLPAYSEFIPPPRLGCLPYRSGEVSPSIPENPSEWHVTEYEEHFELRPGLTHLAQHLLGTLVRLSDGHPVRGILRENLIDNPYWPSELSKRAGTLAHERFVCLMPLALSRTQDDKGRVRWTLFGNSEQGPAKGFWKGFWTAAGKEMPEEEGQDFFRRLLATVYGEPTERLQDLGRAGFRILPQGDGHPISSWDENPLPSWTNRFLWTQGKSADAVKYLLTFRPFGKLPGPVQQAYLAGDLHLIPFPGSMIFWGMPNFHHLQSQLPLAMQIPLLMLMNREEHPSGVRVPQAGWFDCTESDQPVLHDETRQVRNTYKRTHRWGRVLRHEDELAVTKNEEELIKVLFDTSPEVLGLYGKPMARNAQLWTKDFKLLLNGPEASSEDLEKVMPAFKKGGLFGYRFQFPAMRVGMHEIYWQRPLVAYWSLSTKKAELIHDAPAGYLTAYRADNPNVNHPIELWPRLLQRAPFLGALQIFDRAHKIHRATCANSMKLLNTRQLFEEQLLPRSFARQLLKAPKHETLEHWLENLPSQANDPERGRELRQDLESCLQPQEKSPQQPGRAKPPPSLTYSVTSKRSFEVEYWKTIVHLSEGDYINKDNADCISDPITQKMLDFHQRDLEALGDYLIHYYQQRIAAAGMTGKALVGELPFQWKTDFDYSWSAGWVNNQEKRTYERDLVVVIPGRDRGRAVIMGDHYDTAYMADYFEREKIRMGPRLAAAGADDNHSATAALMLGAPLFLELSRAGQLACDIWLIHLTGEEFPSDCLGARHLCQSLVEGNLMLHVPKGRPRDLSRTQVQGVYVLDMIAHNNDRDHDVFQIAPGTGPQSMWLAYQAHLANELWNASVPHWNRGPQRRGRGKFQRRLEGTKVPNLAPHLRLQGEVRPSYDTRSTLYNTDGQIFSDTGIPVVLFMENYDINRHGYHDSEDTMKNIDLDYGAALAAITIETVARAATEKPPAP